MFLAFLVFVAVGALVRLHHDTRLNRQPQVRHRRQPEQEH